MSPAGANTAGNPGREAPDRGLPVRRERRRCMRHKVHTPAYASLRGTSRGMLLDFTEVLDVSEDGMTIQTSSQLNIGHDLSIFLDLPETKSCIQTSGNVVCADQTGRAGISFHGMPAGSRAQLQEWLFVNSLIGWERANAYNQNLGIAGVSSATNRDSAAVVREESLPLLTLSALAAVKREILSSQLELRASLQLIVERAASFTNATGAAIALKQKNEMVCRASIGSVAPPVGLRLRAGEGFSGECLRRGSLQYCEDSETDPLVDRESCRKLGIGSMVAVPVQQGNIVAGLIEVFSSRPKAFTANDHVVLRRLAQMITIAVDTARTLASADTRKATPPAVKVERKVPETISDPITYSELSPNRSRKILFASVVVTIAVLVWVFAPHMDDWIAQSRRIVSAASSRVDPPVAGLPVETSRQPADLKTMRELAEHGDATAQFDMGVRYALGDEVKQDYTQAAHWISLAAEQGHVFAQATLGAYYLEGRGVPKDPVKAYYWLVLASNKGDEPSKYRLALLTPRLTHAQILAAEQQSNDWLARHQVGSKNPSETQ
jgi:putative methionine-R-sulfoxide reductase with GAF domain